MDVELRSELSKQGSFTTTMQELYNWGRKNSVWLLQFGLACCDIEMIAEVAHSQGHRAKFFGLGQRLLRQDACQKQADSG